MNVKAAVEEFILDKVSLGLRADSVRFYRTQLKPLVNQFGNLDIDQFGRAQIRRFFADLEKRREQGDISEGTVAAYDRAVRAFTSFCLLERWIEVDPMKSRPRVSVAEELPDTLSPQEISSLLNSCGNCSSPSDCRDYALMILMLDTGLRAKEVCRLRWDEIEFSVTGGTINMSGAKTKSHRPRVVPFWFATLVVLRSWMAMLPEGTQTVFVSFGNGLCRPSTKPLTPNGLNQAMHERCKKAGVTGHAKLCHIWRHTFAKMFVLRGGDLETLRRILGHATLATVQIYLGFKTADIIEQHNEFSPVRSVVQHK